MFETLPQVSERRLGVRITADALRHVRAGHPWVFDESVASVSHEGAEGDLAVIFDNDRRFVAIGLYDPNGPIAIRVLHVGKPATIDVDFWTQAIVAARKIRQPLVDAESAGRPAFRLINGESDGLPGFVVDRYDTTLVVKLYSSVWFAHLALLTEALLVTTEATSVVLRLGRNVAAGETYGLDDGDVIAGEIPDGPVLFTEGGLTFEADVRAGQKTGHFLDQRANRLRLGRLSCDRDILDVFASTGGFSVHAAAGGARSVHSVDISAPTLAVAERNIALNTARAEVAACKHTTEVGDAFDVMIALARAGKTYDIVIVDPPSFAQKQSSIDVAVRAYTRLTHIGLRLVRPGGIFVQASCSSRVSADLFYATVLDAADAAGRDLRQLVRTGHDIDHPVTFPEGGYLKAGFFRAL